MRDDTQHSNRRFPVKMLAGSALVLLGLSYLYFQVDFLNERFNFNPGIPNVLNGVFTIVLIVAWSSWAFFWAKLRVLGLLIILIPAAFFTLYFPSFGGDGNVIGWKPRFWQSTVEYVSLATKSTGAINFTTTTTRDFPQFLGPHRNGTVDGVVLDSDWKTTPPVLRWKQNVGEGWSGFVAVNGYAVTQEQRGADECVACYEIETGQLAWIQRAPRRHEDITALGKVGPRATPTIDEGLVYVTGGTGVLDCLDGSTGEVVWSADVPTLVGISQISHTNGLGLSYSMEDSNLMWGRSGSPLVYQDKVIVPAGGPSIDPEKSTTTLIAFDKKTGKEIWRGGKRMVAYGSPSLETVLGKLQIVLVAEDHAVGHDPESGIELWNHERAGKSNANANCSQVTFVADNRLALSKGYNLGGELIELSEDGGVISVRSLKTDSRVMKTKLTSPVVFQGHAFSLSDGYLECTDLETLSRKWKQRGRFGNGQLLLVGDRLLVHAEGGQLLLISADPTEFQELGSIKTISGTCWNNLCLYGNLLMVRSELEMACFELPIRVENSTATNNQ